MNPKFIKSLASIGIAVSCLLPFSTQAESSFILATPMPKDHIIHSVASEFMDNLPEDIKVQYHPAGDLGDWASLFEQVKLGAIPMAITFGASDFDKRLDIRLLPYMFRNWESAEKALNPKGELFKVYQEIYDDLDMNLIGTVPVDFYGIAMRKGDTREPTSYPQDAKGIKIRVAPVALGIKEFEVFGFSPVSIPFSELYSALQLGTVDGRAYATPIEIWEMRDVLENYILTNDSFEDAVWVVNKKWWNNLNDSDRSAIEKARDQALKSAWINAKKISEETKTKISAESSVKIITPSEADQQQAEDLARDEVWNWMQERVGEDLINKVRQAVK